MTSSSFPIPNPFTCPVVVDEMHQGNHARPKVHVDIQGLAFRRRIRGSKDLVGQLPHVSPPATVGVELDSQLAQLVVFERDGLEQGLFNRPFPCP